MYSKVPLEKNHLAKMKVPLLVAFSYTRKNIGKLYWKQLHSNLDLTNNSKIISM